MKKLKKLYKNNSLFNVVLVYGTVAVGKFTVANELHELTNYRFFHNHHTHDLARQLFERGDRHLDKLIENVRLIIFKEIADAKVNVVTTHAYGSDFISKTGLSDPNYLKKVESIIEKKGGRCYFVHLIANEKEILKRVIGNSRKKYMKLRDKEIMREILNKKNWKTSAPVKNNLQIDNTNLSPKEVAQIIKKHFYL